MFQIIKFAAYAFVVIAFVGILMLALIVAPFKANFVFADGTVGVLVGSVVSAIGLAWWSKKNGILTPENVDKEAMIRTGPQGATE